MTASHEDDATVSGPPKRTLRVYPIVDVKMARQWRAMERSERERRDREGRQNTAPASSPPNPDEDWRSHYWDVVVAEGPELPFPVEVRISLLPGDRLGCTGLILGDDAKEITARGLREIRVPEIVAAAAEAYELHGGRVGRGFAHFLLGYDVGDGLRRKPRVRSGRRYGPEFFEGQELRRVYADALKRDPRRPARYVAGALYVSEPTAYRWIRRAKALGLLQDPPARERSTSPPHEGGST